MDAQPEGREETRPRPVAWAVAGVLALLLLHLDFWRPARTTLWFGWLPEELLWRLAWMLLAALYLAWFTRRIWTEEER